jgi:hypothetical protein
MLTVSAPVVLAEEAKERSPVGAGAGFGNGHL